MVPAPLAFLRGRGPPRTTTHHQNPCAFEDSQDRSFLIEYYKPTPEFPFSFKQVFPPREDGKVDAGRAIWYLWGGKTAHLKKGDEISVPMWKWHWFEADPDSEEPFSVLYRYDKEYTSMEERFFRNQLSYLSDCRRAGISQSMFQVMVFCMHNWMVLEIISIGPDWFRFVPNTMLMVVLGSIGEFLLGYQASYPEYYSENEKKA